WTTANSEDGISGPAGILRVVEPGVRYLAGSAVNSEPLPFPEWTKVSRADELDYFLPMPGTSDEPPFRTLGQLGADLRVRADAAAAGKGELTKDDPDLAAFDWAVSELLELASNLRERKRGLGLIHPDNIMLIGPAGKPRPSALVLPDWGFAYDPDEG